MNPFFNKEEFRARALIRIVVFLFLGFLMMGFTSLIPNEVAEYGVRAGLIGILFYYWFRFVDRREFKFAGFQINRRWLIELGFGTLSAAGVMTIIFLVQLNTGDLEIVGFGWESVSNSFWLIPVAIFCIQMISVGYYEEVLFRGYLLPNLKEGLTVLKITPHQATIIAVLLSSTLFGIAHMTNQNASVFGVLNIIFAGIMLSVPLILTRRMAISIGMHFGWNFFQGGVYGFRVSGNPIRNPIIEIQQGGSEFWTGGSFGPEGGAIGLIGVLVLIALTLAYVWRINKNFKLNEAYEKSYSANQESLPKSR